MQTLADDLAQRGDHGPAFAALEGGGSTIVCSLSGDRLALVLERLTPHLTAHAIAGASVAIVTRADRSLLRRAYEDALLPGA